jgi:universal stress protein A
VATDFSEAADAALDYARSLAGRFDASLHVIHVVEPSSAVSMMSNEVFISETPGIYDLLMQEALAKLAARVLPSDRERYHATSEVITGQAAASIIGVAVDIEADLIVVGTHGRTGLAHLIMGSVAESVVRHALCPVLTVRQAAARAAVTASPECQTSRFDTVPGLG